MIKHLATHNAKGEPIFYYTLTDKEIAEWASEQTDEQKRLTAWLFGGEKDRFMACGRA